ncbi:hypothetical protein [Actinoplanes sp. N902-109]|uniref:hypothetical protein n=1 Tax=Actinoplanes sp. (strain N902-109) TaxID=649831 RepID=UPI0003294264|nr:hypothetical protein [Actinoplanes sp. N902-109]AGL19341.1 hypothetical protein L083_5831 [Actinoplanes sp. N902-109]
MVAFGGKQAWLAVRDGEPAALLDALDLRDLGEAGWRTGIDLAHLTDDRVVITPPLPGGWVLAVGRHLLVHQPPVDELSKVLQTEVQYFATHRVTETHKWQRAENGSLIRAFGYVGQTGDVTSWFGEPSAEERAAGLPGTVDDDTTVLVSEHDVFRVAGGWSIDPTTLTGPAPGPLRVGAWKG